MQKSRFPKILDSDLTGNPTYSENFHNKHLQKIEAKWSLGFFTSELMFCRSKKTLCSLEASHVTFPTLALLPKTKRSISCL